jgi:hypothetical protein
VNQSDLFSYLSAFVTIVLAIAITDMIQSTHRLIRARRRIKWDVLPLIFAMSVAAGVVSEFFSLWDSFDIAKITFPRLVWMLTVPTLYALLAYSALPDDIPEEGLDLTAFYASERRSWVIILGLAIVLDIVRSVDLIGHNREWLIEYATYVATRLPIAVVALAMVWVGRSRRMDVAGMLLLVATVIYGMVDWTISVRS